MLLSFKLLFDSSRSQGRSRGAFQYQKISLPKISLPKMSFGLVQSGWGESECFCKNLAPGSCEVFKDIFRAYRNAPLDFLKGGGSSKKGNPLKKVPRASDPPLATGLKKASAGPEKGTLMSSGQGTRVQSSFHVKMYVKSKRPCVYMYTFSHLFFLCHSLLPFFF